MNMIKRCHKNILFNQLTITCINLLFISLFLSCSNSSAPPYQRVELEEGQYALTAYCEMNFTDRGQISIEEDYLPHVITCENGAADTEALKAQAVAARSYLYYNLNLNGDIGDGQGHQVYTCNTQPGPQHYAAVNETSGEVLTYQQEVIAAFFVAGAIPSTQSCEPLDSDEDRYNTERYVTYNQGRMGADVIQSTIGWVNPGNIYNRGCKSQNGANCLSRKGTSYRDILKFYYGADITLERTVGDCILATTQEPPPAGMEPPPAGMEPPPAGMELPPAGMEPPPAGIESPPAGMESPLAGMEPLPAGMEPPPASIDETSPAGNEAMAGEELSQSSPFSSSARASCLLENNQVAYSTNTPCAWQACDGVNHWEEYANGKRISCEVSSRCEAGWLFKTEQDGRYGFGLYVPEWISSQQTLAYDITTSDGMTTNHTLDLIPGEINYLGEKTLNTGQKLQILFSNHCTLGYLAFEKIYTKPLSGQEIPSFTVEAAMTNQSGGPSCQQRLPSSSLNLLYVLLSLIYLSHIKHLIFRK